LVPKGLVEGYFTLLTLSFGSKRFGRRIFYTFDTLLDSLDPFLNQNNEKKIEKMVKKVRKSSQSQNHDFDLT
jgi:hypothetical protein